MNDTEISNSTDILLTIPRQTPWVLVSSYLYDMAEAMGCRIKLDRGHIHFVPVSKYEEDRSDQVRHKS